MAKQLLTIGHSYCVGLNRRLGWSIGLASKGAWEVTMVAPAAFAGDNGPIRLTRDEHDSGDLRAVAVHWARHIHLMWYGSGLADVVREKPWDLVHYWEEPYILAGAQIAAQCGAGRPAVFSTFQNVAKRYPFPFSRMEQFCVDRSAGWIASGQTVLESRLERGYGRRPHRTIPLGTDLQEFAPRPEARPAVWSSLGWQEPGAPVVGFLGRFVEEKGLRVLTQALDRCAQPWRALFVGSGPLESFLRKWSGRYGDRVRIATGIAHSDVARYLNAMDLLCAPSQSAPHWREQFGRMLIEAFACGVPVIASDSGEIPFVAGTAARILPERDIGAWAAEIDQVLHDPVERKRMSAAGLARAHEEYDWLKIGQRHVEFFDSLL
jgi:glycosyltransferase involved in cell wall biosynthesis